MKIVAHSDHAAVAIRQEMIEQARAMGHQVDDLGPAEGEKVDYPYAGAVVGHKVASGEYRAAARQALGANRQAVAGAQRVKHRLGGCPGGRAG